MEEQEIIGKIVKFGFLIFIIFIITRHFFGNEIINSWFEKPKEYTTQYWVYLEPNPKSTKNYRVEGDIEKVSLGEDGWGYYLRTVYWDNGGNIDFDDCQLISTKGDYCLDNNDNGYTVRLGEKFIK